jgi:hypothetical protein
LWGALSDERTGLSFVYAAGPRQRSISRVRGSRDSGPYFTVSDLRLPFSSPPTTRRVTVEVFEPAFQAVLLIIGPHGPHRKHSFFYCCVGVRCLGNVFTEPLFRNGRLFIRLLLSNGCTCSSFRGLFLATGLYSTILSSLLLYCNIL